MDQLNRGLANRRLLISRPSNRSHNLCSFFSWEAHVPFLAGIGNLPSEAIASLSFLHAEPENALSLPTWAIHFSSVFEWIFAMGECPPVSSWRILILCMILMLL